MKSIGKTSRRGLLLLVLCAALMTLSVSTVFAAWVGNTRIGGNSVGSGTFGSHTMGDMDGESLHVDGLGRIAWDAVTDASGAIEADEYAVRVHKDGEADDVYAYSGTVAAPYYMTYALEAGTYTLTVSAGHTSGWVTDSAAEVSFGVRISELAGWTADEIDTGDSGAFAVDTGSIEASAGLLNSTGRSNYGWIRAKEPLASIDMDKNPIIVMDVESAVGGYFFRATYDSLTDSDPASVVTGDVNFTQSGGGYYVLRANLSADNQHVSPATAPADVTGVHTNYVVKPGVMSDIDNAAHVVTQIELNSLRILTVEAYTAPETPDEPEKLPAPGNFTLSAAGVVGWDAVAGNADYTPTYAVTATNVSDGEDTFTADNLAANAFDLAAFALTDGATYEISVTAEGDALGAEGAPLYFADSDPAVCRVTYRKLLEITDFTEAEIVLNRLGQQGDAFTVTADETGLAWSLTRDGGWGAFGLTLDLTDKTLSARTAIRFYLESTTGSPNLLFVSFTDGTTADGGYNANAEGPYAAGHWHAVPDEVVSALGKVGDNAYLGLGFGGSAGARTAKITSLVVAEYIPYGTVTVDPESAEFDKANPQDAVFAVSAESAFGSAPAAFSVGSDTLTEGQYTYADGVLTIEQDYLAALGYGDYTLTVTDTLGNTAEAQISVKDSRAPALTDPEAGSAVYALGSQSTVAFAFTVYDKTLEKLTADGSDLAAEHYSVRESGGTLTVTLNTSYLESLSADEYTLSAVFDDTTAIALTLTVEAVELPEATQSGAAFRIDGGDSVAFDVTMNGYTFAGLSIGGTALENETDYTFETGAGTSGADRLTVTAAAAIRAYDIDTHTAAFTLATAEGPTVNVPVTLDNAEYRVFNGGFETGSLYGWTAYYAGYLERGGDNAVTNAHLDRSAFTDARVSAADGREGSYALAVNAAEATQMGYLRSAPFRLGGSGWISFRLGGGKFAFFDYLSVKVEGTGQEVARFSGAGAALTEYVFDLKTAAGALGLDTSEQSSVRYYFLLSEAAVASEAGYSLTADAFVTYYAAAPEAGTTAADCKPAPESADEPPVNWAPEMGREQIINDLQKEGFTTDINDPNFAFFGDGVRGLVRTPAFTWDEATAVESGYTKVGFYLGSGRNVDYGLISFISFKEVGTNREVHRTWVSGDGTSSRYLSVVDMTKGAFESGKAYYIEICNNITGNGYANIAFGQITIMYNGDGSEYAQIFELRAMDTTAAGTALNDTVYDDFIYIAPGAAD